MLKLKNGHVFIALFCFLGVLSGCSRNGIEGNAQYFGSGKAASGINIAARTETDIKEEQAKASVSAKTDSTGHFTLKGLLPNRVYRIQATSPTVDSTVIHEAAPEKGTRTIKSPVIVCPKPPINGGTPKGVWLFDYRSAKFDLLRLDKPVQVRVHENAIEGGFGFQSAFSISDSDVQSTAVKLPRDRLLAITGGGISDLACLFKVPAKAFPGRSPIQEGWYYNVTDFYEKPFMISTLRQARVQKPNPGAVYKSQSVSLVAISLNSLNPGVYFLTTSLATGQRASEVLFGEDQPQQGYVIKVE